MNSKSQYQITFGDYKVLLKTLLLIIRYLRNTFSENNLNQKTNILIICNLEDEVF